jgi:hypothetical protein
MKCWWFRMKVGDHKYYFLYGPPAEICKNPRDKCTPAGYDEQEAVARYVVQTLARLAPGSDSQ